MDAIDDKYRKRRRDIVNATHLISDSDGLQHGLLLVSTVSNPEIMTYQGR